MTFELINAVIEHLQLVTIIKSPSRLPLQLLDEVLSSGVKRRQRCPVDDTIQLRTEVEKRRPIHPRSQ
jgi:hypothetical protein